MSIIIHSKFSGYFFKSLTSVLVLVLTGLSPPRKSAASVCMWQLMEDRSLPSRDANKWQRVVLPHLYIVQWSKRNLWYIGWNETEDWNWQHTTDRRNQYTLKIQTNSPTIYLLNSNKAFSNIFGYSVWTRSKKTVNRSWCQNACKAFTEIEVVGDSSNISSK